MSSGLFTASDMSFPGAVPLQQGDAVADDQAVFVSTSGEVRAIARIPPADPQILQRATLEDVLQLGISLPLIARGAPRQFDIMAFDVARHEGQAWRSNSGEIEVVPKLP